MTLRATQSPPSAAVSRAGLTHLNRGLAFIWLATGLLILHPNYRQVGGGHLNALGLPGWLMVPVCALEVLIGWHLVARGTSRALAALQAALIGGFSLILAGMDPWLLVHPFGVLTKNLPILALIGVTWRVTLRGWDETAWWGLRLGMALIWVTEGLLPKILFPQAWEVAVVANSGLAWGDPATFLKTLGAAQVSAGLGALCLRGHWLKWLYAAQLLGLVVLPLLVSWQDPLLWVHPFGPMTKNVPIAVGTYVLWRRCSS